MLKNLLVLALTAMVVVSTMPVLAATPGFTVAIDVPDEFAVGDNEIEVTIDNSGSSSDLFSPIVEMPLGVGLSVPTDPAPRVKETGDDRTWAVLASSFDTGDALYVYGENVPAGESRTYVFTITVDAAGDRTLTADVRPLYNEPNNVRTSVTETALDAGTLNVSVVDAGGSAVAGAAVTVDGTDYDAGSDGLLSQQVAEGTHDVSVSVGGETHPAVTATVPAQGLTTLIYVHDTLTAPRPVLSVGGPASVAGASVGELTVAPGSAVTRTEFEVSFDAEVPGDSAIVAVPDPDEIPDAYSSVAVTVDGTTETATRVGDQTQVTLGAGSHDVTVRYVGFFIGDADDSGTVDGADAAQIAQSVASGSAGDPYADVDGDGEVTAVDAMLVAQYDAGNRTDDYRRR